jgi:hypothetical protein
MVAPVCSWRRPSRFNSSVPDFLGRFESAALVSRTMKDVEDFCAARRRVVVDEVISHGKTKEPTGSVRKVFAAARIFAEQPETFGDRGYYFFGDSKADARGPFERTPSEVRVKPKQRLSNM